MIRPRHSPIAAALDALAGWQDVRNLIFFVLQPTTYLFCIKIALDDLSNQGNNY